MSTPLVACRDLVVKRLLREVVTDLAFSFNGGILGVMGPNGSGKTTLLRVLGENARYSSGLFEVFGESVGSRSGRDLLRRRVGYQPQRPSFVPHLSVRENLRYAAWLKRVPADVQETRLARIESDVRLQRLHARRARQLSGGELKRLAIGMALVHEPALLVLDEPTAALDPDEHDALLGVIREVANDADVVFSSHDPADIAAVCDQVLVVARGTAQFDGSVGDLTLDGQRTVVEGYRAVVRQ